MFLLTLFSLIFYTFAAKDYVPEENLRMVTHSEKSKYRPVSFNMRALQSDEGIKYDYITMGIPDPKLSKMTVANIESPQRVITLELLLLRRGESYDYDVWVTEANYASNRVRMFTGYRLMGYIEPLYKDTFFVIMLNFPKNIWGFLASRPGFEPTEEAVAAATEDFKRITKGKDPKPVTEDLFVA